jgi:hypothetical protein
MGGAGLSQRSWLQDEASRDVKGMQKAKRSGTKEGVDGLTRDRRRVEDRSSVIFVFPPARSS